ncbi:LEF-4 [Chrysodeixis chalcites nucleopolyhedrovirus]|uniref:LEF-4 n=1 Tax=Chrysodeixis chalcites nucleopolyhedrovirus TaxID=320432 RepID=Q4KSZ7_9ABAC|nr:LEF-4 [Chrysodeixis chalcites nucleopolyhedrovirus]AGC36296.1 LEF-4 protein [Chrysodeixis chalcites SNPV TF1-A]AAY84014.1 LEF-4 [Chrysodeixis chalcites nucleopolyhedrovirus]AGE61343.1 LEF-4 [Chrysodeixis chalcites nucleopolyhedrovirus]AGE61491.1 LEF-4 [Chrysodeixis chalcites nucleopolyhedrovirus]AGE61642.1 LEF-4 [Chrysodeixis chalcites nucleopolyhedrovirus]
MAIENEISYSINLSQDLLYIILDSYISKKFIVTEEYTDFVDENNVRTRRYVGEHRFVSVKKTCKSLEKIVFVDKNIVVPFVNRISFEEPPDTTPTNSLRRIIKCKVYKSDKCPDCEIKFEHVYFNKNKIDNLDSLMATKQMVLYNLLQNKNETLVKQSHLGSDEILANLRLEYEYTTGFVNSDVLKFMSTIVRDFDEIVAYKNISPMLPYTTLQNHIIYRKFEDEKCLMDNFEDIKDVYKWALKLDGIRGRGFITKKQIIIFMDDMQIFSGPFDSPFSINNVIAFQCELIEKTLYITDLLHVFKYTYNNRTQYECSLDPYNIDPATAIDCINLMANLYNKPSNDDNDNFKIYTFKNETISIKFQKFYDPPIKSLGYSTLPTDGFVVLDTNMSYVKYKYYKTVELEYDKKKDVFKTLESDLEQYMVTINPCVGELKHESIYEAIVHDNHINVIKYRPDRLIPN